MQTFASSFHYQNDWLVLGMNLVAFNFELNAARHSIAASAVNRYLWLNNNPMHFLVSTARGNSFYPFRQPHVLETMTCCQRPLRSNHRCTTKQLSQYSQRDLKRIVFNVCWRSVDNRSSDCDVPELQSRWHSQAPSFRRSNTFFLEPFSVERESNQHQK